MNVELLNSMGDDLAVVNAARVSFHKESDYVLSNPADVDEDVHFTLPEKDQKLIQYLANHGHWSPFAHCFLSFRIKAPIFVARQLVKHQVGLAWNEVSRRYVDETPEFYEPTEWRLRAENVKQGSSDQTVDVNTKLCIAIKEYNREAAKQYSILLDLGIAPEQARMVLPQSTYTEWIWSGSLMAFSRVCKLRLDAHAQKETQTIAKQIDTYCSQIFPYSWKALQNANHN